jgi:streptogramin lyase
MFPTLLRRSIMPFLATLSILAITALNHLHAQDGSYVVSTLAGSGSWGSTDGTGTSASFSFLSGVAVDASGNVYVADSDNQKIRKITPSGVVSTLAGSGSSGSTDGTGTSASFRYPSGVALDASGNVYVADYYNHKIRKITPSGVVSTFAGSGSRGSTDGTGTSARFYYPSGVALDASGNVYVADSDNNKIRKITPSGVVSTLAGSGSTGSTDGTGTSASFYFPRGVALDASGNVYVADSNNHKIRKITPSGVASTLAGSGSQGSTDGTGTSASFNYPSGVAVDANGNVYVADWHNQKIRKITPSGVVSTLAGSGSSGSTDGTGTSASFYYPHGVAVDAIGDVYVADSYNHKIRKIGPSQRITFNALSNTAFGSAAITLSASASSGLPVTFSIVSGPATLSGSSLTLTGVGTVTVRASQAGNSSYGAAPDVERSFTVSKASQSITFGTLADAPFTSTPITINATASSALPVTYSIVSGPASITGSNLTLSGVGTVTVSASQVGNDNYNAAPSVNRSFTVSKGSQTIIFDDALPTVFTNTPITLNATASSKLPVTYSIVSGPASISGSNLTLNGLGTVTVRASQVGNDNYNAAPSVNRSFTVSKGFQTIIFDALSNLSFTSTPITLKATASSKLPVTYSIVSGPASISGSNLTLSGVGTVTVSASQEGNDNYNAAPSVNRSFTVYQGSQTITFDALSNLSFTNTPITLDATASSGLPVTFSIVNGPANISGSNLTLNGVGTVTVRASQAGNDNYTASSVNRSFTVLHGSQTITFGNLANVSFTSTPITLNATASSGLPVTFSIVNGPANISGSNLTLTGAGTVTVRALQFGNQNYNAADNVDRSFTVSKGTQSITSNPKTLDHLLTSASFQLGSVSFNDPRSVAVDASGNVYVADWGNNKIRKITPSGVVSTLAGTGSWGSTDGTGTSASFNNPRGVAVDASGNVYVADSNNHKIRKITPSGVVSTLAGSDSQGSTDGTGTSASFNNPRGVAVDASGNVYVADSDNHKIRKITPSGVVSTLAGSGEFGSTDGTGTSASFSYTQGVAMDASGNVYVADFSNNKIRKITPNGVVSTLAGSGFWGSTDGTGTSASFSYTQGVAMDASGNVYVADIYNHKIRKITPSGVVSTLAGSGSTGSTDGTGTSASFNSPTGVAVDASGNVYVADWGNNKIRKITPSGVVSTFAGSGSRGSTDGLSATLSSGNTLQYEVVSGPANITNSLLNFTGEGKVTLRIFHQGDANYNTVSDTMTFNVTKATQTMTFPPISSRLDTIENRNIPLTASSSSGLPISYSVSPNGIATIDSNGNLKILKDGTITVKASQAGDNRYKAAQEKSITFTVHQNKPPTALKLSKYWLDLGSNDSGVQNLVIGTMSVTNPEDPQDDPITYSLVPGDGSNHNDWFEVAGNELLSKSVEPGNYSIRLRARDSLGQSAEQIFKVVILDPEPNARFINLMTTQSKPEDKANYVGGLFQLKDTNTGKGINYPREMFDVANDVFTFEEGGKTKSGSEFFCLVNKIREIPTKIRTVLLLDTSNSNFPNQGQIKEAAKSMVDNMFEQQEIAIYYFANKSPIMASDFTNNKNTLKTAIDQIPFSQANSTNLHGSLITVLRLPKWKESKSLNFIETGFLVLLSDGDDTANIIDDVNVVTKVRDDLKKSIYCIGFGDIKIDSLNKIQNTFGFISGNNNQLTKAFEEVQQNILREANSYYSYIFSSALQKSLSGSSQRTFSISLKNNQNSNQKLTGTFNSEFFVPTEGATVRINAKVAQPLGVDRLYVDLNKEITANAITANGYDLDPKYEWILEDTNLASLQSLNSNKNQVVIRGGKTPGTTKLTAVNKQVFDDGSFIDLIKVVELRVGPLSNDATLKSLAMSGASISPAFSSNKLNYSASVANNVSSIALTPSASHAGSNIQINGTIAKSGISSSRIPLKVGVNNIEIKITAENGTTTKTYKLTVNRAKSSDATLSALTLTAGKLNPTFSKSALNYKATVLKTTASIQLRATASNSSAGIKINGAAVKSGALSAKIPLKTGNNTISISVTAANGTVRTYKVVVTR